MAADGNDAATYELIASRGYSSENPDSDHTPAVRHVRQEYDAGLSRYVFAMDIHIDTDTNKGEDVDRQRNELKTDKTSPSSMYATEGQTLTDGWLFKLPSGMQTTTEFTHVHQIKGIDNTLGTADVDKPVITFTCRSKGGVQMFQVIHVAPSASGSTLTYLAETDLTDFLGEWVLVEESMLCDESGSYSVTLTRVRDSRVLVSLSNVPLVMWRDGAFAMRPKWGIYRSFGVGHSLASQLRDETLLFSDFSVSAY